MQKENSYRGEAPPLMQKHIIPLVKELFSEKVSEFEKKYNVKVEESVPNVYYDYLLTGSIDRSGNTQKIRGIILGYWQVVMRVNGRRKSYDADFQARILDNGKLVFTSPPDLELIAEKLIP